MDFELTKKDWRVLYELEKDARQPLQSIARKVGLSKQLVSYMMKKYEKQNIILAYTTIIDSSRLGYYTYRVYLKFRKLNTSEQKENFFQFLVSIPETTIVNGVEGYWDVGMAIAVTNIYDFYMVWNKIMSYKNHIHDYKIAIYSPISHFTRTLISPEPTKELPRIMVLGGKERIDYDEEDVTILKELARNSRSHSLDIAKKMGKSPQYVSRRINHLEEKGVIQGYRPLFNWALLDYHYYKIDVELESFEKNKEMFQFCREHPNVIQVNQTIGGSDFEFEVFVKDKEQFQSIMDVFQTRFSDVIVSYEYFTVTKPYKETFMAL